MSNIVRINFNTYEEGEEYLSRLGSEGNRNFQILLALLSSYWQSTIDGPNYARELKAISLSLARLRLMLEDLQYDQSYATTRTEYIYQLLTSVMFPGVEGSPNLKSTDIEFREFLNKIILLYFAGSVPNSIQEAVQLITGGTVNLREDFLEARKPGSGYDISDEFSMDIDVILSKPGSVNTFLSDRNIRILLGIIRPAHTLYRLRYILADSYVGVSTDSNPIKIADTLKTVLSDYSYEDFRKFVDGVFGVDPGGVKMAHRVTGEDYSSNF